MEDQTRQCRIPVDVSQFTRPVAIVDVDGHGTDLEARQHGLDVLGSIGQLDADVISGTNADALEIVGETIGAPVQVEVGEPSSARHHGGLRPHLIDHALEEIGKIELHGPPRSSMGHPRRLSMRVQEVVSQVASPPERWCAPQ